MMGLCSRKRAAVKGLAFIGGKHWVKEGETRRTEEHSKRINGGVRHTRPGQKREKTEEKPRDKTKKKKKKGGRFNRKEEPKKKKTRKIRSNEGKQNPRQVLGRCVRGSGNGLHKTIEKREEKGAWNIQK